jgi:filamentous hemagglutinin
MAHSCALGDGVLIVAKKRISGIKAAASVSRPQLSSLALMMASGMLGGVSAQAQTAQVPRVANNALPVPSASGLLQRGLSASYAQKDGVGTVTTKGPASILRWSSMDVGKNASLNFQLDGATARVLNKVEGGAYQNMTVIEGAMRSNGQVYIYNPNGTIIGRDSRIDVNSLVISSLKVDDDRFMNGLLSPSMDPSFYWSGAVLDPAHLPTVLVESGYDQGVLHQAVINSAKNGLIMLVGPQVQNQGVLNASDGQVVLAAGTKVYLASPQDIRMRGLRVEVSNDDLAELAKNPASPTSVEKEATRINHEQQGRSATNDATGVISVGQGNATMVALSVNQMGMVSATTSVNLNGSIILKAQDGAVKNSKEEPAQARRTGTLTLGEGSTTAVLPRMDDTTTTISPTTFNHSTIDLMGQSVTLGKRAVVAAPSGDVTVIAQADPRSTDLQQPDARRKVVLEEGAVIDVAGTRGYELAMERNVVEAELRGGELADNILLRDNPNFVAKTVYVDARIAKDTKVASLEGWLGRQEHLIGELTAAGGTVKVRAEGSVDLKDGSTINVSGGSIRYLDGHINTTKLTLGRAVYGLEKASVDLAYDGLVRLGINDATYEQGYTEGRSAGKIQLIGPMLTLGGDLKADVVVGERQRELTSSNRPAGGQLELGNVSDTTMDTAGRGRFTGLSEFMLNQHVQVTAGTADQGSLKLDLAGLAQEGFRKVSLVTKGAIDTLDVPLSLGDGFDLRLASGQSIDWRADVTAASGAIVLSALDALRVGPGVSLDVAGRWVNDLPASHPALGAAGLPVATVATAGGRVVLAANDLSLGRDVELDVSGGAWLSKAGALPTWGAAGAITLQSTVNLNLTGADKLGHLRLGDGVNLLGLGGSKGGSLNITAPAVQIGHFADIGADALWSTGDLTAGRDSEGQGRVLRIDVPNASSNQSADLPSLFGQGGFASFSVQSNSDLTVKGGAQVTPRAQSWLLNTDNGANYATVSTGASIRQAGIATATLLPLVGTLGQRQAASITLRSGDLANLTVEQGAAILTDPGSSITLSSSRQLWVDGTLSAPAGNINLYLNGSLDLPYDAGRTIWLGAHAQLLAQGSTARLDQSNPYLTKGDVLDGGSIRIGASGGSEVGIANAFVVAQAGALLDVSGATAHDVSFAPAGRGETLATAGSAGGSIDIRAREGLLLAATLKAQGGSEQARGGSLNVALYRDAQANASGYPTGLLDLNVNTNSLASVASASWGMGQSIVGHEGQGLLPVASWRDGGFARLSFKSQGQISFSGAGADGSGVVGLSARASLVLDTPVLKAARSGGTPGGSTDVQLTAPYISLGNRDELNQAAHDAVDGQATLTAQADTIDLIGHVATAGFGQTWLKAGGDVRLSGVLTAGELIPQGAWAGGHALTLQAAQVYPTTLTQYSLVLSGTASTLTLQGSGQVPGAVLSALGQVTLDASDIVQAGHLLAPFGQLTLHASHSLVYAPDSLTSVAGNVNVPLGEVVNGTDWVYNVGSSKSIFWRVNPSSDSTLGELALPAKRLVSQAPDVQVQAGATLDLAGTGELYAFESISGSRGSGDVLSAATGNAAQVFAINPNWHSGVAPKDLHYGLEGLNVGDQVYLSGGNGLAAGYYTLLPAHDALQSGGYLISAVSGSKDMVVADNRQLADGSSVIAGFRSSSLDGSRDLHWSGFRLSFGGSASETGSVVRQRSEYKEYRGSDLLKAQVAQGGQITPWLPVDGGQLVFDVVSRLTLDGQVRLQAGQAGAARGIVDITAPYLAVSAEGAAPTGSYVQLFADDLSALQADSLLLGGLRHEESDGLHLSVKSQSVRIDNDDATPLKVSDLIVVAKGQASVSGQAVVQAEHVVDRASPSLIIDGQGVNADGAFLRLSGGQEAEVQRATPAGLRGTLDIAQGATLSASGAVYLDATRSLTLDTALHLGSSTALNINAAVMSFGVVAHGEAPGLHFDADALDQLNKAGALHLKAYQAMDWFGAVQLGSSQTNTIELSAPLHRAHDAQVLVQAHEVMLEGDATPATLSGDEGVGELAVQGQQIRLGDGEVHTLGFAKVSLNAAQSVAASGDDGRLVVHGGDLLVQAPIITTLSGKRGLFIADGHDIQLAGAGLDGASTLPLAGLGGQLTFSARNIQSNANVVIESGQISLAATDTLDVSGGLLSVAGHGHALGGVQVYAPAGNIVLDGGSKLNVAAAATLDVSATNADAGLLSVRSMGAADDALSLSGALLGQASDSAGTGYRQGRFALRAQRALKAGVNGNPFSALNQTLNSGGFTESRDFHFGSGDITVGADQVIQAQEIRLAVDQGTLTVQGTLNASGATGGSIDLYVAGTAGGAALTLDSTARLMANATAVVQGQAGTQGRGGRVTLGVANTGSTMGADISHSARLVAEAGSVIDVSAADGSDAVDGAVFVRAPRVGQGAGQDVAVETFASTVKGQHGPVVTTLEAFKVYQASTITANADSATNLNAGVQGRMATEAQGFMANAAAVAQRLGSSIQLTPGIEVQSSGNLTVSVNERANAAADRGWDLNAWRYNGAAGALTLRAAGDLVIQGSISDGFVKPGTAAIGMADWALDTQTSSWSYRLVAGASLNAADPLALGAKGQGELAVTFARTQDEASANDAPLALVRTGTGRIDIASAGNVRLDSAFTTASSAELYNDLVNGANFYGAQIYTGGRASSLAPGMAAPLTVSNLAYGSGAQTSAQFGLDGGGISVVAMGDVVGAAVPQMVNDWLFRQGRSTVDASGHVVFEIANPLGDASLTLNTAWWSRWDEFRSGIATFGGGDVVLKSGGDVRDLSLNAATSGYVSEVITRDNDQVVDVQHTLVEQGGGDVRVEAGGDWLGGSLYVQKGVARVRVAGSVQAGSISVYDAVATAAQGNGQDVLTALKPIVALGDAQLDLSAGRSATLETIYNPTQAKQSSRNTAVKKVDPDNLAALDAAVRGSDAYMDRAQYSAFSTYGEHSAARLLAVGGQLTMSNNLGLVALADGNLQLDNSDAYGQRFAPLLGQYPGTLQALAISGDVHVDQAFSMAPAALGQLDLVAGQSVVLRSSGDPILMQDNDPAKISRPLAPTLPGATDFALLNGKAAPLASHTAGQLHADDDQPVHIVAANGNIDGQADIETLINVPKLAQITASGDIHNLGFRIQHNRDTDQSILLAGGDIVDDINRSTDSPVKHVVGGPGLLSLIAGGDINLGNGYGVVTRGNLDNPYLPSVASPYQFQVGSPLPSGGASVMLLAGALGKAEAMTPQAQLQRELQTFQALVLANKLEFLSDDPANKTSLDSFKHLLHQAFPEVDIDDPLAEGAGSNGADAVHTMQAFQQAVQGLFPTASFKDGSTWMGTAATEAPKHEAALKIFDAIAAHAFPAQDQSAKGGDILLYGAQVKTEQGGSIDLLAPQGSVIAGLTTKPDWLQKSAKDNGVFTVRGGDLRVFVRDDILVNNGRLFTLAGGNITLVSQEHDIDAGGGSKTASSAPPPLITTDAAGNIVVDIGGSVAGSGIAMLKTTEAQPDSKLYAVAPRGKFDAGDAGVRSSGGVDVVAKVVLHADNIKTPAGSSSIAGVSAAPAAAPAPASTPADTAKQLSVAPKESLALTVEYLGYGEDSVDADEDEELARKKRAAKAKKS